MKKVVAPPGNESITKRTISWETLWRLRPDLKPSNDNKSKEEKAA